MNFNMELKNKILIQLNLNIKTKLKFRKSRIYKIKPFNHLGNKVN